MENKIQLNGNQTYNSYLHHFNTAQFNLRLLIREEARYGKKYKPRNTAKASS